MPIPQLKLRASRVYGAVRAETKKRFSQVPWHKITWKRALFTAAAFFGFCFIFGTGLVLWISKDLPDPDKLTSRQVAQSTKIYDRTGEHLLYEVYDNEKRTIVDLDQISPWVIQATIAIEDKHFYEHKGVRVISIARAGFNNLIGRRVGSGGASTLTQQLIKLALVGDARGGFAGLFRKVREAILAIQAERVYTKDQILKMYFNQIPYGSTNYGVESASQSYFQKPAKDLTLAEGATLAALTQAPSRYLNNLDSLRKRRDYILGLMKDQGYINEEQMTAARVTELTIITTKGILAAPHFVSYVKAALAEQFGDQLVDTGGLKVLTSLDYDKQIMAEKIVKEQSEKLLKDAGANNVGLTAIDPKTGQILVMVGSRDYNNNDIAGKFNVVTQGRMQPGSSLKPFVYLAGFEKGYTPETVIYDVTTDFDQRLGGRYAPKNYDGKEHGLVTVRAALQGSLNIPAVKMMYLVGEHDTIDLLKRFGYTTLDNSKAGLSLVLGGAEINLLEHTNAYATLANGGTSHDPVSILKVENPSGEVLFEWKENPGKEIVRSDLTATLTNVLSDNNARAWMFGLNSNMVLPGRPVAAKTGTTQDTKDAWTMGYVPSLAAGVWVGNTPLPKSMSYGGNTLAGKIWNEFMKQALKDVKAERFPAAPVNTATKPVLRGSLGGIKLPIDTMTGRIATSSTPPELIVERAYLPPHDILHYVSRSDPRGPAPTNPADDPQYENWEGALRSWVNRRIAKGEEVLLEEPPTEYDSPEVFQFLPTVEIISPVAGEVITTRDLNFQVKAGAPRGVVRVRYYIDGKEVALSDSYPFSATYQANTLTNGQHTLKAVAEDDLAIKGGAEINFTLQAEQAPASFEWFHKSPISVTSQEFAYPLYLSPFRWEDIDRIEIFLQSANESKLIYTFGHDTDQLLNNQLLSFSWLHYPGEGTYTLQAIMYDKQGRTVTRDLVVNAQ